MSFEHIVFITGEINAYSLFLDHLFLNYARFFTEEKKCEKHRCPYLKCLSVLPNSKIGFDFYG